MLITDTADSRHNYVMAESESSVVRPKYEEEPTYEVRSLCMNRMQKVNWCDLLDCFSNVLCDKPLTVCVTCSPLLIFKLCDM